MRKFLLLLALPVLLLAFQTTPLKTDLLKAGPKYGYVKDDPKIELGSGGIIVHAMDGYHLIAARAVVVEKKNGLAKVEFKIFKTLAQRAMPTPIIMPTKGDELILNYLYNRVVIIAPNSSAYKLVKDKLTGMDVVNSDLLAAYLIDIYSKIATRKNLRGFCRQNAVGTVVIALKKKAYLYDCLTFNKLNTYDIKTFPGQQKPFYSNITQTRGEIISILDDGMGEYYYYYKQLTSY